MPLCSILKELREFDTALLANTIGYIDSILPHQYYMGGSIQSATPSLGPTVGVAVTCELDSSTPGGEANLEDYYHQVDQISKMKEPVVWVVKTVGSRPDHECVLGEGMAKLLHSVGCLGVVTDGGVRDVNGLLTVPFAAYCKGKTVHHCPLRFRGSNQPVEVGGIVIRAGDVIHANSEGVIRIPESCLKTLAENAVRMCAFEREAHAVLRQIGIAPSTKREQVQALLLKYGFTNSREERGTHQL